MPKIFYLIANRIGHLNREHEILLKHSEIHMSTEDIQVKYNSNGGEGLSSFKGKEFFGSSFGICRNLESFEVQK